MIPNDVVLALRRLADEKFGGDIGAMLDYISSVLEVSYDDGK